MAATLDVSPDLQLPADVVTQAIALVAVRRAGKSNAAAVMAEAMFYAGLSWVAIDPKGDWFGLRSNVTGDGPGLPIPIFGGLHGDLPLAAESGRLMAELVVEHNLTCVLDVSRFSKAGRTRFLTDFALRLYELHQADPHPRHVFLEEADRALPQMVRQDMAACVGAWSDLVRLGGAFGLGVTLISQRCAVINKDALTQVEIMVALRTTSPQDRKAIHDWMEHHAIATEIVDSLPSLLSGEAWVSSSYFLPEHGYEPIQRIRFRQRATFDSGATPKVGERRRVATLADIDLGALETRMAAVVEKAAQDDPKALKKEIAELKRELAARGALRPLGASPAEVQALHARIAELEAREPERVEVPVFGDGQLQSLYERSDALRGQLNEITMAIDRAILGIQAAPGAAPPESPRMPPLPPVQLLQAVAPRPRPKAQPVGPPAVVAGGARIGKRERAILTVLAQFPSGRTHRQIALLTGYSPKASTIGAGLSTLRKHGYVSPGGNPVLITPAGVDALGDYEGLPSGPALLDYWNTQLGARERALLAVLLDRYPATVTHAEMAEATSYSPDASTIGAGMSKLRGLGLADGWAAAPDFVEAIHG